MDNPKAAIEALLETDRVVEQIKIYPITLARYGLLELIDSPFVKTDKMFNLMNIIPSLYIMNQPIEVLKKYRIRNIEEIYEDALRRNWNEYDLNQKIKLRQYAMFNNKFIPSSWVLTE